MASKKISRRAYMQVGNKLRAIAQLMRADQVNLALNYAAPINLYFKISPQHMIGIPQIRISAAVEMGNTNELEAIATELLTEAFAE